MCTCICKTQILAPISKVATPPRELWGRAGACRLRQRGDCDLTPVVAYLPLTREEEGRHQYMHLLEWMQQILDETPNRSLPIFLLDSNAHLRRFLYSEDGRPLVGNTIYSNNNWAGQKLSQFMFDNDLAAINTMGSTSQLPTWYGAASCSLIDLILLPATCVTAMASTFVAYRLAFALQTSRGLRVFDHVPVI